MPSAKRENFFGPWTRSESSGNLVPKTEPIINTESYSRTAPTSPSYRSPLNSPVLNSPPLHTTLKRHFSSTFMLIPEDRELNDNDLKMTKRMVLPIDTFAGDPKYPVSKMRIIIRFILWWPLFLISITQKFINMIMQSLWQSRVSSSPAFWFSACLWMIWKFISYPLEAIKNILIILHTPSYERNRKKRTILISGGSTLQALHLARNFYSTGARVIVFDFEGLFGLARFSTAVTKFYTLPKEARDNVNDYISALCDIVTKEQPTLYIPTCSTSPAYFDSLAKPHLELAGCTNIFIPGAQEVSILDDIGQILKKCESRQIAVPPYRILHSKDELMRLYETDWLSNYRNVLVATGINGIIEREKYILPINRRDLKINFEISEERPWIVLRDVPGRHFVTCTTVKNSKVIANVTCSIEGEARNLVPVDNDNVNQWLKEFFEKVQFIRPINGHISFRFVQDDTTSQLLTLGTRVGVTLSYLCYTGVQPRIVARPCPHFERQNSGPVTQERYWLPQSIVRALKKPTRKNVGNLIGTVVDKREALFLFWDPLPYCAYYHFQLPFNSVLKFLQNRSNRKHHHASI